MAITSGSNASFIPKRALEPEQRSSARPVGLLLVISVMLLLISGIIFGGALLYRSLLANEIEAPCGTPSAGVQRCGLKATVERERRNIDQNTIRALQRLDYKLQAVDGLLAAHKDLLRLFRVLEENTLPTVGYTGFNYSAKNLTLDGLATSYEDIAVQTQVFNEAKRQNLLEDFIFSDLDRGEQGLVRFKLTMVINPDLVLAVTPLP